MSKQKLSKSKSEINPGSKLRVLAVTTTTYSLCHCQEKNKNKVPGCTCTHRHSTHITLTLRFKVISKNNYTPIYILFAYMRSNERQQLTEVLSFVTIDCHRISTYTQ